MLGLTFEKLLLIGVIAFFVIGPERLPRYTAKLTELVRQLRDMANGAKTRMRDELGPEFDEVDWRRLDPRQYDPRRIIREALTDDPVEATATSTSASSASAQPGTPASAAAQRRQLTDTGVRAPFDDEAT